MDFGGIVGIFVFMAISLFIKSVKEHKDVTEKNNTPTQGNLNSEGEYQYKTEFQEYDQNYNNETQGEYYTDTKEMYEKDLELFIPKKDEDSSNEENKQKGRGEYSEDRSMTDFSSEGKSLEGHSMEGHSLEGYSLEGRSDNYRENRPIKSNKRKMKKVKKDVIRNGEIGSEEIEYNFDEKDLVKGIIMSEILSKPKSIRKNN